MLNKQQFYLFGQLQISQTGHQPYSDTFPYGECPLDMLSCYTDLVQPDRWAMMSNCKDSLFSMHMAYFRQDRLLEYKTQVDIQTI